MSVGKRLNHTPSSGTSVNHRDHWEIVRELGCCISRDTTTVTIHHCHGASVIDTWGDLAAVGMAQRQNHYLVIPLAHRYHVGDYGIDYGVGVRSWEKMFDTQVRHLLWVDEQLDYDIFELAEVPRP